MSGVQGATSSNQIVLLAGLTAMFAGAVSMAAGAYLSSKAERQVFEKEVREQAALVESEPYLAGEGIMKALEKGGLGKESSYRIAKLLMSEKSVLLRTFQEKVLGLGTAEISKPIQAALVMACAFMLGTMFPLLPYLFIRGNTALYSSIVMSGSALFSVGALKGRMARKPILFSGMEFLLIALGSAALGYTLGLLLGTSQFV